MQTRPGFLESIRLKRETVPSFSVYPFSIPALASLEEIPLHPQVTFFVGENGSGKSTLVEALAIKCGMNAEGGGRNFQFSNRASHSTLSEHLWLERSFRRPTDDYFLRAESFFNVATEIEKLGVGGYGEVNLHEQSHGQSFFALLTERLRGDGLYIFDEPEAALSPQRQMSMLVILHRLVQDGSQFIIATHSPIIMAYPDALIYLLDDSGIHPVAFTETDHYRITRDFLNKYPRMLATLLERPPL